MTAIIEWVCTQCGLKTQQSENTGRPIPGCCTRNDKRPHEWVENRRIGK